MKFQSFLFPSRIRVQRGHEIPTVSTVVFISAGDVEVHIN